MVKLVCAT